MALEDLWEAVAERGPTWTVRVTLEVIRERTDLDFDAAWHVAHQRLRTQPNMSADDVDELLSAKAWMDWARPYWKACYELGDPPPLVDGQVFLPAENVTILTRAPSARGGRSER